MGWGAVGAVYNLIGRTFCSFLLIFLWLFGEFGLKTKSRLVRDRRRSSPEELHNVMTDSMLLLLLKFCFTSTETVGLLGTGAQDVHLDFHTAPEL